MEGGRGGERASEGGRGREGERERGREKDRERERERESPACPPPPFPSVLMAGPYRAPVMGTPSAPPIEAPASPPPPFRQPRTQPSPSYSAMVVVLIVLVSFCVINRWWWWWRGRVLARRRAAALQEERNREAEMISSNTLPEDAITVAVRQLPEISWDTNTVATMADSEESECRLCLEDYRVGEKVRLLAWRRRRVHMAAALHTGDLPLSAGALPWRHLKASESTQLKPLS